MAGLLFDGFRVAGMIGSALRAHKLSKAVFVRGDGRYSGWCQALAESAINGQRDRYRNAAALRSVARRGPLRAGMAC